MSDDVRSSSVGQWGRPLRKRSRGPQAQPSGTNTPAVGPVDADLPPGGAETIVRASSSGNGAPRHEYAPLVPREPDAKDEQLRDLITLVARGLVDHPDDVGVAILGVGSETSLELHVNPDDLGHVIGKQGRTARSMRLVLGAAAAVADRRASLEIAD